MPGDRAANSEPSPQHPYGPRDRLTRLLMTRTPSVHARPTGAVKRWWGGIDERTSPVASHLRRVARGLAGASPEGEVHVHGV